LSIGVSVNGEFLPLSYSGAQPAFVGVDQINFRLPRSLAGRGDVEVFVEADDVRSNIVKVNIK
jgi:uncharacterized protein (TIGR03437 family)